jgi:hypothetical protein
VADEWTWFFLIMNDTLTSMNTIWFVNNLPLNHVFQECMSQGWFVCHVLLLGVSLDARARYLIAWALKKLGTELSLMLTVQLGGGFLAL